MGGLITNYWFVLVVSLVLSGITSLFVKLTYKKYNKITSSARMKSDDFVLWMLRYNNITDVKISHISGELTDNYNPTNRVISLSGSTSSSASIAAIGVAAHETGHAIQHHQNYFPVHLRTKMVPVVNIGSNLGLILCIIGSLIFAGSANIIVDIGLCLYSLTFLFTLVTLPVEFNASHRALKNVRESGYFTNGEIAGMRSVLTAAALTYVASMVVALLNLVRLVYIFGGNRRK